MKKNSIKTNIKYDIYLDEWLRSKSINVKASTLIRYQSYIEKHIKPELGRYRLNEIDSSIIEQFVLKKQNRDAENGKGTLSSKTVSDIVVVIKSSLRDAQNSGINIESDFKRVTVKKTRKQMRVLSVTEERKLLSVLLKNPDRYKLGVFICLYTGIRIGELCALKWKNISLEDKTIKIDCTMQRLQSFLSDTSKKTSVIISEPKSFSSTRIIPLPEFVAEKIKPFRKKEECFVLSGKTECFVEPRTMQNYFKRYIKEGNIDDANFHSLRHTFATRCVEADFDIKSLSEILGHSSVSITLDKYVHSSIQQKRKNMEKLTVNFKELI